MRKFSIACLASAVLAGPVFALEAIEVKVPTYFVEGGAISLVVLEPCGIAVEDLPESYTSQFQRVQTMTNDPFNWVGHASGFGSNTVYLANEECLQPIRDEAQKLGAFELAEEPMVFE